MNFTRYFLTLILGFALILNDAAAQPARWISVDNPQANEPNTWIEFCKSLTLKKIPRVVEAKIAVDSKYWLFINGEMAVFEGGLKRGPNPSDTYYDTVDIAPYLRKGNNEIRLLVWYFGKHGFSHNDSGRSGLLFDAASIGLASDSSWESRRLSAYQSAVDPEPNYRLSESNIRYDARLADTDSWTASVELGEWGAAPWGDLVPRPIPQWKNYGVKNLSYEQALDGQGNVVLSARLPYNTQLTPVIDLTADKAGTVIRFHTDHLKGGGEYGIRAEYVTVEGRQKHESLGWMNGDVLYVTYPADSGISINLLAYRETGYDCRFDGSFICSDDFVNRFWDKAVRTLYVNMRDTFFDCPDRERAQWWGDATVLYGQSCYQLSPEADALMCKAMHELAAWQKEDGVLYSPIPSGSWVNELPAQMLASVSTYGFWYYYVNTGDAGTIADVYPAVKRYLSLWTLDADGLTEYRHGGWSWGDWGDNIDIRLLLAAWHYLALESASDMAAITGNEADIPEYRSVMTQIAKAYARCWNGYAYRHPSYHGKTDDRVNAMAVLTGIADRSKYDRLFEFFVENEHASPYMEKYVLEALMKMGHGDYALKRFKKRFSEMVEDKSHSTLYEGWEEGGYGGGSTNHAWSGGMATVIAENVCGVRPVAPGWTEFEIRPYPVIPECTIVIPTVKGSISSSFKDTDKDFTLNISVPKGASARIVLPSSHYMSVMVNGARYDGDWTFKPGSYEVICTKQVEEM